MLDETFLPEKEIFMRLAQEVSRVGFFIHDTLSNNLEISDEIYSMFVQAKENFSSNFLQIMERNIHPEYRSYVQEAAVGLLKNGTHELQELKIIGDDGTEYWIKAKVNMIGPRIFGVVQDITYQKHTERILDLKDAVLEINHAVTGNIHINEFFHIILKKIFKFVRNADMGSVLVLDEENNLKIVASLGYDKEKAKEFSIQLEESFIWYQSQGLLEKTVIINDVDSLIKAGLGYSVMLDNDKGYSIKSTISAPIFIDNKLYGLLSIDSHIRGAFDLTDWEIMEYSRNQITIAVSRHRLYEETIYLSRHDKLTDIYNRRYFEELLFKQIEQSARYKHNFSFAVFDLNRLKRINDTYGHLSGDEIIRHFAKTLRNLCRSTDIFARFGGDEFVAIFPETEPAALAIKFTELNRQFNENPIDSEGNQITCSFSYGIASYPTDGSTYDQLVRVADKRMYQHKRK